MSKMTVADAAEHFNVSKEAIHNRIRRGTLDSIIENGVKYVVLPDEKRALQADSRFHDYIENENERLKAKNDRLEAEINRLRDQREAMLIAEREKVEQIYKERDEQLKSVLQVFASKLLPAGTAEAIVEEAVSAEVVEEAQPVAALGEEDFEDGIIDDTHPEEPLEDKPDPFEGDDFDDLVSLKNFMKLKGYGKKQRKRVKERFEANADSDSRILVRGGKIHLRPYHYDYGDLLK